MASIDNSSTPHNPTPVTTDYRWIMLGAVWLLYACFGLVLGGIPPLVVYLMEDLGMSRSAMGTVLGAWQLVYIGFAVPAGALIDRFGLRFSLAAGVLLIAVSGILRALAGGYATLFLAVAAFGLGGPFISIGAPKTIGAWFDSKDRGAAMGIYLTAPVMGRMVALATANSVFMPLYDGNWRLTLATYAGIALLAVIVWLLVARDPPDSAPREADTAGQRAAAGAGAGLAVFPQLLRLPVVRIILLMSVGSFLFNHGLSNWLPEILRFSGMSAERAGLWATLPAAVGLFATLLIPRLAVPHRRVPLVVFSFLVAALAVVILSTAAWPGLLPGLVLAGIGGRGVMPILMLILMDSRGVGTERIGAAGGLFFMAGEVGGVLGPVLLGTVSDLSGSFGPGLLGFAAVGVALSAVALRLGMVVRRTA